MDEIRWNRCEGFEAGRVREVEIWLYQRKGLLDQVWIRGEDSPYAENTIRGSNTVFFSIDEDQ